MGRWRGVVSLAIGGALIWSQSAGGVAAAVPAARSAAAPSQKQAAAVTAAVSIVAAHGYTVTDTSTWQEHWPLNVLIGTKTGSADGYDNLAFFFYNGTFLGTDTSEPSARIIFLWGDGTTIALLYVLYRVADPYCCPTAGGATVRYQWNGSALEPLDPIPSNEIGVEPSRR